MKDGHIHGAAIAHACFPPIWSYEVMFRWCWGICHQIPITIFNKPVQKKVRTSFEQWKSLIPQKFLPNYSPFFSTTTLENKNLQKLLQCMRLSWIWCTLILEPRICVPCPERTYSAPKDVGRAKHHSLAIVPTLGPQQQVLSVPRYQRCDGSPTLPIHNWPAIHDWW